MIEIINKHVIPAAFEVLPAKMRSLEAHAFLLAVALQETKATAREQFKGPARSFWQFEEITLEDILARPSTRVPIGVALRSLHYDHTREASYFMTVVEHNDVVAACFARCLLWMRVSEQPPGVGEESQAWDQYREAWKAGKPRAATWPDNYRAAWQLVLGGPIATRPPLKV